MKQYKCVFVPVSSIKNGDDYLEVTHWVENNRNGDVGVEQLTDVIIITKQNLTRLLFEFNIQYKIITAGDAANQVEDFLNNYLNKNI